MPWLPSHPPFHQVASFAHADTCGRRCGIGAVYSRTATIEAIWRKIKGDGVPFFVISDDPFEYDVQRRVPDTAKAKRVLGFEAAKSLEDMLDEVVPWITEAAVNNGTI